MTGLSRRRVGQILAAARRKLEEAEAEAVEGEEGVLGGEAISHANILTSPNNDLTSAEAEALAAGFADVERRTAVSEELSPAFCLLRCGACAPVPVLPLAPNYPVR